MARKPSVTKEQIAQAREVDLLSYLQGRDPAAIKPTGNGNEYRLAAHDSFKISNGKWHWFSRGFGGNNALDYLVKVQEMDFVAAVSHLCGIQPGTVQRHQPQAPDKPIVPFALPPKADNDNRTIAYLAGRGIDRLIVETCINEGIVYESAGKYHNCIFVGRDSEGIPKFASARGFAGTFKQDVPGSDKRFNFLFPARNPECRNVAVCESAIDALSYATLLRQKGPGWQDMNYLALSGTSPLALKQFLSDHPKVDRVYLCLDRDAAGSKGTKHLQRELLNDAALFDRLELVTAYQPPTGKDYNEYLQFTIKARAEQQAQPKKQTAAHSR